MKNISTKTKEFNDFRFSGLNWYQATNKYYSMDRVSSDQNKIIVKVGESHLKKTKFGYALILDASHVVFLKDWQVSDNYYGVEVLLQRDYFDVKEWGDFSLDFDEEPENLEFDCWLKTAKDQDNLVDEDGEKMNKVRWQI